MTFSSIPFIGIPPKTPLKGHALERAVEALSRSATLGDGSS